MARFVALAVLLALAAFSFIETGVALEWFHRPSYEREILIFLTVAHLVLYSVIRRQIIHRPEAFVKVYLGTTVLRILFFGIFVFMIIRLDPAASRQNALFFLISYFLFTGLEVAALYIKINGQKTPKLGQKEG